jgi:hypothetical protein
MRVKVPSTTLIRSANLPSLVFLGKNKVRYFLDRPHRPVSLLPTKILEKVIYKRMFSHLNNHNILVKEQFGFRKKILTSLATHNLWDNIYTALNNKCIMGGIFCDLS